MTKRRILNLRVIKIKGGLKVQKETLFGWEFVRIFNGKTKKSKEDLVLENMKSLREYFQKRSEFFKFDIIKIYGYE